VAAADEKIYRFEFQDLFFQANAVSKKALTKNSRKVCKNRSGSRDETSENATNGHQALIVKLITKTYQNLVEIIKNM